MDSRSHDEEYGKSQDEGDGEGMYDMHDMKNQSNHLNSLFNGHLMKWKYEAEEGSSFLRVPAFLGAIGGAFAKQPILLFLATAFAQAVIFGMDLWYGGENKHRGITMYWAGLAQQTYEHDNGNNDDDANLDSKNTSTSFRIVEELPWAEI